MMDRVTRLFALWTVLGVSWAWFIPDHFVWVADGRFAPFGQPLVSVMLGVIMLGMGITLSFDDFRRVLALPSQVLAGVVLQFTIMPLAGFLIAWAFRLEPGLAVGLILVACCPGGTASNVVSYLARANVALSVTMTMVSTLVAIALTPVLTGWLAGVFIQIDRWNLFQGMVTVVLIPVVVGVLMNRYLPRMTRAATAVSPAISVLFVVLIVAGIIAKSKPLIEAHADVLLIAVFALHCAGFGLGYGLSKLLGLSEASSRTISIEVGMQNSGLGASLASTPSFARQFPDVMQAALAPVPAAISAVFHVLIGSLLASLWSRRAQRGENEQALPAQA
jgi:BASS family bile acid:Na+ symporter